MRSTAYRQWQSWIDWRSELQQRYRKPAVRRRRAETINPDTSTVATTPTAFVRIASSHFDIRPLAWHGPSPNCVARSTVASAHACRIKGCTSNASRCFEAYPGKWRHRHSHRSYRQQSPLTDTRQERSRLAPRAVPECNFGMQTVIMGPGSIEIRRSARRVSHWSRSKPAKRIRCGLDCMFLHDLDRYDRPQ